MLRRNYLITCIKWFEFSEHLQYFWSIHPHFLLFAWEDFYFCFSFWSESTANVSVDCDGKVFIWLSFYSWGRKSGKSNFWILETYLFLDITTSIEVWPCLILDDHIITTFLLHFLLLLIELLYFLLLLIEHKFITCCSVGRSFSSHL